MTEKATLQSIILVPANLKSIQKLYINNTECRTFSWLYLSKDALFFTKLRTSLPKDISFVDTGDLLQDFAHRHRQDYIDFIGSLSVRNNSLYWWLTSVSEKNPFISTVFLYFCYLKIIEQFSNSSHNLVIICDSYSLIDSVMDNFARRSDLTIRTEDSKIDRIINMASRLFSGIIKKGFFTIRFSSRIGIAKCFAIAKGHKKPGNTQKGIALHSWTDVRSFRNKREYHDTYFGNLKRDLMENYSDFYTISYVLPTFYYPKAVVSLTMYEERIFLFEEFLSQWDVFRSLFSILFKMPSTSDVPLLSTIDLSSVIRHEIRFDRYASSRSETALLHYYAGKRIACKGHLKTLIYTFENHMWEKMLCSGIRQSDKRCQLIGYAHSVISPMYLFYTRSRLEYDLAPIPDYIMVNGILAKDRLSQSGFDRERIIICGALRYNNLNSLKHNQPKRGGKKVILVIPTSGFNETVELIDKVYLAFREFENITVIIKPHPTIPADKIIRIFSFMPRHFSFSSEAVEMLLNTTDLVLFSETAVSIEALARHIPILHVKSDLRIDMNLFEGIPQINSVRSPEEIRKKAFELLTSKDTGNEAFDKVVTDFFAPVDEKLREIFTTH